MKKLFLLLIFIIVFSFSARAQTADDKVCISQSAADECASCVLERKELRAYKEKADADILARDKIIEDLKIKLAMETQKSIDLQAEIVNQRAIIQYLLPMVRKKKIGLINIF